MTAVSPEGGLEGWGQHDCTNPSMKLPDHWFAWPRLVDSRELVSTGHIAERLGVDQRTVSKWVARHRATGFPPPIYPRPGHTGISAVYVWSDIVEWKALYDARTPVRKGRNSDRPVKWREGTPSRAKDVTTETTPKATVHTRHLTSVPPPTKRVNGIPSTGRCICPGCTRNGRPGLKGYCAMCYGVRNCSHDAD